MKCGGSSDSNASGVRSANRNNNQPDNRNNNIGFRVASTLQRRFYLREARMPRQPTSNIGIPGSVPWCRSPDHRPVSWRRKQFIAQGDAAKSTIDSAGLVGCRPKALPSFSAYPRVTGAVETVLGFRFRSLTDVTDAGSRRDSFSSPQSAERRYLFSPSAYITPAGARRRVRDEEFGPDG